MALNKDKVRLLLKDFSFRDLFINELGWNNYKYTDTVKIDEAEYIFEGIAEKCGVGVFKCSPRSKNKIPEYNIRKRIETQVAKSVFEHLIIFSDNNKQIWQWAKREKGKPVAIKEEHFEISQSGERLIQKLEDLAVTLKEEEDIRLMDVTGRIKGAFDVDKVTKRFYDYFKKEHDKFTAFIDGIDEKVNKEWYASLMLNRLMFIYFIQKKGFLDNDNNYLRNKLTLVQSLKGKNKFYSFYRSFLMELFHKGLNVPENERTSEIKSLIGRIPYLNGGLFDIHLLEKKYPKIEIPDDAFKKIFDFFDMYQWHLDDRPLRSDYEINPDVLGYIFEKYINQKEMGAYYTKEDITEYISKNAIIPFIIDEAKKECAIAFKPGSALWKLLQNNPDRYIYDAVKYGTTKPLPPEIEVGIKDVSRRTEWNKTAPEEHSLPTEIWREVVARRQRYEEVKHKITKGEITEINDFITYNLNIRQFIQDVVENCEGPELLRAIYYAIAGRKPMKSNEKYKTALSILDLTCGSGAFLFAALNILEPLYEGCLNRMQRFLEEHPEKYDDFRQILKEADDHPNLKYFIYKSIILNNLYGVDIMNEAVEIAKLRLFLKLVALVDADYTKENMGLEPLPDIDFNIRAGNSLVGFATLDEVKRSVEGNITFDNTINKITEKADKVSRAFQRFRQMQQSESMNAKAFEKDKSNLRKELNELNSELNSYLAGEYIPNPDNKDKYEKWLQSHQPFHWLVEFYDIIHNNGGFDVIIGNPPYVEYSKVKKDYIVKNYKTEDCGNLYAFVIERCLNIIGQRGLLGVIIPLSGTSTDRMSSLQSQLIKNSSILFSSYFPDRPSQLFDNVHFLLSIIIMRKGINCKLFTTKPFRFFSEFRQYLFNSLIYLESSMHIQKDGFPKIHNIIESSIINKLSRQKSTIGSYLTNNSPHYLYYKNAGNTYYRMAFNFKPKFSKNSIETESSTSLRLFTNNKKNTNVITAIIESTLFNWYWFVYSDNYHLTKTDITKFPINLSVFNNTLCEKIIKKVYDLMEDYQKKSTIKETYYKSQGTIIYQEFYPRESKSIIDEIDKVLAEHYGFTDEELDFIINYDIKYRMGKDSGEDESEE